MKSKAKLQSKAVTRSAVKFPKFNKPKPINYKVLDKKPNLSAVSSHEHFMLFEMLTMMRPDGSKMEQKFCDTYIVPIADKQDKYGNYHKVIGDNPKVLFSSHTDSVHHVQGYQNLAYDQVNKMLYADESSCLGADDGTGVYIMLKMIEAGVEGHYIFHRAEEVGCKGSKWLVKNTPEVLENIDVAVAFDRKGYTDVITEQSSGKCASEEAGQQLADMLNAHMLNINTTMFKPSPNGVYTDTAHFNTHVSECFNLSVGYFDQHTKNEAQDLNWLSAFVSACCEIDWSSIKPVRDTDDIGWEDNWYGYGYGYGGNHGQNTDPWKHDYAADPEELVEAMMINPHIVADYLSRFSMVSKDDLEEIYVEIYSDDNHDECNLDVVVGE